MMDPLSILTPGEWIVFDPQANVYRRKRPRPDILRALRKLKGTLDRRTGERQAVRDGAESRRVAGLKTAAGGTV